MHIGQREGLVALRGVIWGIAGGFFGTVLLGVLRHLEQEDFAQPCCVTIAAAVAGAVVGGASAGVALEILGVPWLDRVWGEKTRSESPPTQSSPSGQWRPAR